MEVSSLDRLMNIDTDGAVKIRSCPLCNKPIINTPRYQKLIKVTFDTDIQQIKGRIQGNVSLIRYKQCKFEVIPSWLTKKYLNLRDHESWLSALEHITMYMKKKASKLNQIDFEILRFSCSVMAVLSQLITQVRVLSPGHLLDTLNYRIDIIAKAIINIKYKLSAQQQKDVRRELLLLRFIAQYLQPKNAFVQLDGKVLVDIIKMKPFDEEKAKNLLQNVSPYTSYTTIGEKSMIVRAMGLSQGHWYKCPNGHYYCIGACSGAMQQTVCPECKEDIGGSNHRWLSSNLLASEIDGATHSA